VVLKIRSRNVVLPDSVRPASIEIRDGRIAAVEPYDRGADIDAGDDYILPGLVDTHVHINEPGRTDWEGFRSATRAAAAGGYTTLVDMPLNNLPATTTVENLRAKESAALGECMVDYAFWGGVVADNQEHIAALAEAGVSFEIVPGITAAFAAAAAIGCSLTSRNSTSNVIFSTGHHAPSQAENRSLHAPLPQLEDATRVVYMPGRDLCVLAQQWLDEGLSPDLPCAVVSRAAQPGQQIHTTTLAALGDAEPALAPSLLIAGWALLESSAVFTMQEQLVETG